MLETYNNQHTCLFQESTIPGTRAVYEKRAGEIVSCQINATNIVHGEFVTICDSRTVRGMMDKDFRYN